MTLRVWLAELWSTPRAMPLLNLSEWLKMRLTGHKQGATERRVNIQTIADYFITKPDLGAGDSMTQLKLQKLLYYAQAWHLALHDEPLFSDPLQAWAHGPVAPVVYERFKVYSYNPIPVDEVSEEGLLNLTPEQIEFLDEVWDVYGGYTAKALEDLTHREAPWIDARGDLPSMARCEEEITQDAMQAFFKSILA